MSEKIGGNHQELSDKELANQKRELINRLNGGDIVSVFRKNGIDRDKEISDEEISKFLVEAGISDEDVMVVYNVKKKFSDYR